MRPLPENYRISLPYKAAGNYLAGYHTGVDFAAPTGTPIHAPHKGTVVISTYDSKYYGHYVVIESWTLRGKKRWLLAHMSERRCAPGESVQRGDVIGLIGETGNATGPHTHAEQRHSPYGYHDHEYPNYLLLDYRP